MKDSALCAVFLFVQKEKPFELLKLKWLIFIIV